MKKLILSLSLMFITTSAFAWHPPAWHVKTKIEDSNKGKGVSDKLFNVGITSAVVDSIMMGSSKGTRKKTVGVLESIEVIDRTINVWRK